MVSAPIVQFYYTQFIGDAVSIPTIKATAGFAGIAMIDSDPYIPNGGGANWYTNQNNFFRQVRNFVIDLTNMPMSTGAGIHWQVAQATSLQNIVFNMVAGGGVCLTLHLLVAAPLTCLLDFEQTAGYLYGQWLWYGLIENPPRRSSLVVFG